MKEEQKQHLIDMMKKDEELGLYDIFNDEKKQGVKELIDKHKLEEVALRLYPIILEDDGWDKNKQYRDQWIEGAKWQQEQNDTSKVTRVEVIQHSPPYNGRAYTNYFAKDVEIQFQDDGKTLKIFLK